MLPGPDHRPGWPAWGHAGDVGPASRNGPDAARRVIDPAGARPAPPGPAWGQIRGVTGCYG